MSDEGEQPIERRFADLSPGELHDLLKLRVDVFVVEQDCAYPEIDGRDTEPATRHLWFAGSSSEPADGPEILAYVRVLDDGDARRIGRVVTAPAARGRRLAARLVAHAVATSDGPWVLGAQAHLADWYGTLGFSVDGPGYLEDGIPHVPMRRT